jgi:hypothetical protein
MNSIKKFSRATNLKYNLYVEATSAINTPEEVIGKIKTNLRELYDNFFNEIKFPLKVISMDALFQLKNIGEPHIVKLFEGMEFLNNEMDSLSGAELYNILAQLLNLCNEITSANVVNDFLIGYNKETGEIDLTSRINRPLIKMRQQLIRGMENRMSSVSKRLSTALRIVKKVVPEQEMEESKKQTRGLSLQEVELPSRHLEETLIRRFLASPAAANYGINEDNWDDLFTNPAIRQKLVHLVHKWELNNNIKIPELRDEIAKINNIHNLGDAKELSNESLFGDFKQVK